MTQRIHPINIQSHQASHIKCGRMGVDTRSHEQTKKHSTVWQDLSSVDTIAGIDDAMTRKGVRTASENVKGQWARTLDTTGCAKYT